MVDEEEITGTIPIGDAKTDQHYHKIERFHHLLQADAERRKTHLARRLSQLSARFSLASAAASQMLQAADEDSDLDEGDEERRHSLRSHRVHALQRTIQEETVPLKNNDPDAPLCECGLRCSSVAYEPPPDCTEDVEGVIYLCPAGECLYWKFVDENGEDLPVLEGVVIEPAAEGSDPNPNDGGDLIDMVGEFNTIEQFEQIPLDKFWDLCGGGMTPLDEESAKLIMGVDYMDEAPPCNCEEPHTSLVQDTAGDMYWICGTRGCYFVNLALPKPSTDPSQLFDTGQEAACGEMIMDRYTSPAHILAWFGRAFSLKFLRKLMAADRCEVEYPPGSYKIPAGTDHDVFLSYRGETGRVSLFIACCAYFNSFATMCTVVIVFPIIAYFLYLLVPEPFYYVPSFFLSSLTYSLRGTEKTTTVFYSLFTCIFPSDRGWYLFMAYGSFILIAVYWFWNPVGTWWRRGTKVWIDKHCIHQSHEETQRAGLYRMPLYLKNSKMICCVFDAVYITRMWCIFELAIYLRLRKKPRVLFINTSQKLLEIVWASWRLGTLAVASMIRRSLVDEDYDPAAFQWYRFIDAVLRNSLVFLLAQRYFRDLLILREVVSNYDVRKSTLGMQNDRPMLLQFINYYWGNDRQAENQPSDAHAEDPIAVADDAVDGIDTQEREAVTGLDRCNQDIRERVIRYLPMRGPRSWMIVGYATAVILSAPAALVDFERWAYHAVFDDEGVLSDIWRGPIPHLLLNQYRQHVMTIYFTDLSQGITSVLSLCSKVFLIGPMSFLVLGAEIRFFLWIQQLTKLPYWLSVVVVIPFYLLFEAVLSIRFMLFFNLQNAVSLSLGSSNINIARQSFTQRSTVTSGANQYVDSLFELDEVDDASVSFLSVRQFYLDDSNRNRWYPFVWRPFWGIFYLWQWFWGCCQISDVWRPDEDGNTEHQHWVQCEDRDRALKHPDVWGESRYAVYYVEADAPDASWENGENQLFNSMRTWNQSYRYAWKWGFWSTFITWVFVIIPFSLCLYYVCETPSMRVRRLKLWSKMPWRSGKPLSRGHHLLPDGPSRTGLPQSSHDVNQTQGSHDVQDDENEVDDVNQMLVGEDALPH